MLNVRPAKLSLGFTGAKAGMNPDQYDALDDYVWRHRDQITQAHHGDCVGADAEFHELTVHIGLAHLIHIHPPSNPRLRAYCSIPDARLLHKPRPYLVRNRDIAYACDVLIAAPQENVEVVRSGVWATVRYARRNNKNIVLFLPNGKQVYT